MGFDSTEMSIASVTARIATAEDRGAIDMILHAADQGIGGVDNKTSFVEVQDFLDRNPDIRATAPQAALQQTLEALRSASDPGVTNENAKTFLTIRSDLARITRDLEKYDGVAVTDANRKTIQELEAQLQRATDSARDLSREKGFGMIAAYANAAIIRLNSVRRPSSWGEEGICTPSAIPVPKEAALPGARLQLAALKIAAQRVAAGEFKQSTSTPTQVYMVSTAFIVLSNQMSEAAGYRATPAELVPFYGEYNQALRDIAAMTYAVRYDDGKVTRHGIISTAPTPLVVTADKS